MSRTANFVLDQFKAYCVENTTYTAENLALYCPYLTFLQNGLNLGLLRSKISVAEGTYYGLNLDSTLFESTAENTA
jgi:hypothetical protein